MGSLLEQGERFITGTLVLVMWALRDRPHFGTTVFTFVTVVFPLNLPSWDRRKTTRAVWFVMETGYERPR